MGFSMKWILLTCTLIFSVTAIYCAKTLAHPRYTLCASSFAVTYRIDHQTGMVWLVNESGASEVHDPWLKERILRKQVNVD
jgi:hypothetical protein